MFLDYDMEGATALGWCISPRLDFPDFAAMFLAAIGLKGGAASSLPLVSQPFSHLLGDTIGIDLCLALVCPPPPPELCTRVSTSYLPNVLILPCNPLLLSLGF